MKRPGGSSEALVDLDAALLWLAIVAPADATRLADQQKRRGDLARRDARSVLDRLIRHDTTPFPLGEWLSLISRTDRDPDLATLRPQIDERFRAKVRWAADTDLASARNSFALGRVLESLQDMRTDRSSSWRTGLPISNPPRVARPRSWSAASLHPRRRCGGPARRIRLRLIAVVSLQPVADPGQGAGFKGYLPYRSNSRWAKLWGKALYHLELSVRNVSR